MKTSVTRLSARTRVTLIGATVLVVGWVLLRTHRAGDERPAPANDAEALLPPVEAKAERVEVRGRVLGPDDRPLAGAKLYVRTDQAFVPAPQATANEDGTFAFRIGADERNGTVLATAPGHGVSWWSLYARPLPELVLRLPPDDPIRGTVVDPEGKPVAGVSVSVYSLSQPAGDKSLDEWLKVARDPKGEQSGYHLNWLMGPASEFENLIAPATSDRDGKFEIRGVGRDRVAELQVTAPNIATHKLNVITRRVEWFTVRTRFPGDWETTCHGAEPVVTTTPVPVTSGRVLDGATGAPVPGTALWLDVAVLRNGVAEQRIEMRAMAGADGRFTLPGLPQGWQSRVYVVPPDGSPYHRLDVTVPDGAAERAGFDLKVTRGVPTTVKIIDQATRQPVKASLVYDVFPADNPNVGRAPNLWHEHSWHTSQHRYGAESEYRIVVFPGKGLLAAHAGYSGEYLTGVGAEAFQKHRTDKPRPYPFTGGPRLEGSAGGRWFGLTIDSYHTFAEIDVPADAKEFAVTLELDSGLTVSGRLVDAGGRPVIGAESYGLNAAPFGFWQWSQPARDAKFAATVLRPGERRRVMFVHTARKLAGSAVVVGGSKEPVAVRLEPWGEVTGRLVGADRKPVADWMGLSWSVGVDPDPSFGSPQFWHPVRRGRVEPDGRFRITGLVPGLSYRVSAAGPPLPREIPWHVGWATPKAGETIDLGDVTTR